jgi:histidinol-phosphate aminotransferase
VDQQTSDAGHDDKGGLSRRRFGAFFGAAAGATVAGLRTLPVQASLLRGEPLDLVQLNSNENPYGPSAAALAALAASQAVASRYPDAAEEELTAALARLHGVPPERIVLGCGSSEVLRMADAAFLSAGRTLVAADPTFEAVLAYARVTSAEPVRVPLSADFRHDLPAMAAACDARTGLAYVCNPNNPTGTIVSGAELAAFVEKVPATAAILVDEAYHHFVEDPAYRSALGLIDAHPNVVVARTFSKIYGMAGLRLGYAVASQATAKALRAHASWGNTNAAALTAALASLAEPGLVEEQRQRLNGARRALCAELARDGRRVIPSEANFVMIDVGTDVKPLIEAFRARRILVGRRFDALPTWLRVTIGRPAEMAAFLSALREIAPARALPAA